MTNPFNKAITRGVEIARNFMLDVVFPKTYTKYAEQPINPKKILFVETKLKNMPDSFFPMWDYLQNNTDYEPEFFSLEQLGTSYYSYYKHCKQLMEIIATARCVFLSDSSDIVSCIRKREGTVICQLWHACGAFKKWGLSNAEKKFGPSYERLSKHPYNKNLDLVTISSPEVTWAYIEAMGLEATPEIVQATGVSRTDVFYNESFIETTFSWLHEQIPQANNKKVILYAPTFRGVPHAPITPVELDISAMAVALQKDYILLIKHHPFIKMQPIIPDACRSFAFLVNDVPIDKLLTMSDICITDYSSVIFEYSLFERPMIFFPYDMDEFTNWREFYYPYDDFVPGPIVKTTAEIISYIQNIESLFDKQRVINFKTKFMSACDGRATERICKHLSLL